MLRAYLLLIVFMLIVSCYSTRIATRQVWKAQAFRPEVVAQLCSDIYITAPDSNYVSEVLSKGHDSIVVDTVFNVRTVDDDTVNRYVYKIIHTTDTLTRFRYVQMQDKALQKVQQLKIISANNKLIQIEQGMKIWRGIAIACLAIIAVWTVLRIWF